MPTFMTPEELSQHIVKCEKELTELRNRKKELLLSLENTPEYFIADLLHEKQCHFSHEDQCGYHYETWENPGNNKLSYLKKAKKVIATAKKQGISDIHHLISFVSTIL